MKASISNLLYNRAGFNAYRYGKPATHPFLVDLVGPPGIGKTRLIQCLINSSILHSPRLKFDKRRRVCRSRARLLSIAASQLDDMDVLQRKAAKILYDLNMSNYSSTVVVDEGLSHHFTNELYLLSKENPTDFNVIMGQRAIINLTATPETINYRIRHRTKRRGNMLPCHQGKTDDELLLFNIQVMRRRAILTQLMEDSGFPALTIDMETDETFIIDKIREFILKLEVAEGYKVECIDSWRST